MIEIDIPTIDPVQHEPKIFLGMTKRQVLCVLPGVALAVGLAMLFKNISIDLMVIGVILGIAPAVLFGWLKPYNMPLEKYLLLLWNNQTNPQNYRIYTLGILEQINIPYGLTLRILNK